MKVIGSAPSIDLGGLPQRTFNELVYTEPSTLEATKALIRPPYKPGKLSTVILSRPSHGVLSCLPVH